MAQNQIAIYPVDLRGLVVQLPGASSHATGLILARQFDAMDQIARLTGGRAFYSNNGINYLLQKATRQGASYYTLSYSPTDSNYDGRRRSIEVKLARKGYTLAYRRYYIGRSSGAEIETAAKKSSAPQSSRASLRPVSDSLFVEMQHGAPMVHDLLFKVHLHAVGPLAPASPQQMSNLAVEPEYFRARRRSAPGKPLPLVEVQSMSIACTLPARQLDSRQIAGESDPALEFAAAAYDADGRMLNGAIQPVLERESLDPLVTPAMRGTHSVYRIEQQFDVPAGSTSIRIAVRDMRTDRLGAIELPLPLAHEAEISASGSQPAPARTE